MSTFLFDLDGVVYLGSAVIPAAPPVIQALREQGHSVVFATNNSTRARPQFADALTSMGIPATTTDVLNSTFATALYIQSQEHKRPAKNLLLVGEDGLRAEFAAAGLPSMHDPTQPTDYVVVGLNRSVTYAQLAEAQQAILNGADFVATNRDPQLPVEGGGYVPGAGALVAAIEVASKQRAVSIGKPEPRLFQLAMDRVGATKETTVVVGDGLTTDILAGSRVGAFTVLVLTGVSSRADLEHASVQPNLVIASLDELVSAIHAVRPDLA